ncbi:MAG: hypothetical protein ACYC4Q_08440 [Victivallaceae bacterium]
MKGLRSGQSVTPTRKARATAAGFGGAIGKRTGVRARERPSFPMPPRVYVNLPPPCPEPSKESGSYVPCRPMPDQEEQAFIYQKPIRPLSLDAEMWEDYHIFKAAGLLKEWRRKWAAYLPSP